MSFLDILGWVAVAAVSLYGLMVVLLPSSSPDAGTRWMMKVQGFTILVVVGLVVFVLPISNLFVLLAFPVGLFLPMLLMRRRAASATKMFERALAESQRTGRPTMEIMKDEMRRRGYEVPDGDE